MHGLVEATKRAFLVRDRVVTDPAQLPHPPARYLEKSFLDIEAEKIDRRKAAPWPAPRRKGDTVWMGAADASGLVVSYIQSLYWEFGSGCVLPRTGVLMQNRGASFSLEKGAVNPLEPGRQPFHTLNPALAVLKDGRVMAYGTMGGDGQPQSQAALFTRHVLFRQPLEQAVDRPRWLLGRTWGSTVTNLRLESRFGDELIDRLMSAGHDVEVLPEAYSDTMGHAGAVVLHPNGTLEGAAMIRAPYGGAARTRMSGGAAGPAIPVELVIPARLRRTQRGEQDAEREADADTERHHRLGMPADLLAHHIVDVGGAVLHAGGDILRHFARRAIGVGGRPLGLLVKPFGLAAGLLGDVVRRLPGPLQ